MYSGERAIPAIFNFCRRPLRTARRVSPGWNPCASQNGSLAITSPERPGSM